MSKKEIVVCDNCGRDMPEDTQPIRIGSGVGRGRQYDVCGVCLELLLGMNFQGKGESLSLRLSMEEVRGDMRKLRERLAQRDTDMQAIRSLAADAIIAWGEGNNDRGREFVRRIATRAATQ